MPPTIPERTSPVPAVDNILLEKLFIKSSFLNIIVPAPFNIQVPPYFFLSFFIALNLSENSLFNKVLASP